MSITVRTLMTPPMTEDDKRIGWIDRPILGDVTHDVGARFTVDADTECLHVWDSDNVEIAVYARHNWIFGRLNDDENAEAIR